MVPNRILAVGVLLSVLLAQALTPGQAREIAAPPLAVVNLEQVIEGKPTASVNAGGGVTLGLATVDSRFGQDLTIMADGRQVQKLEGGRFMACARLEAGPITYWGIAEFTGGAHCCGQFAFLARAAAGQPVRYLGQTVGYNGGPRDFPGSFIARQGQLYFESFDNRFDYFHASHADSLLVNVPRTYYRLTPDSLTVNNIPFKPEYMNDAAAVDGKIHHQAAPQDGKAKAILKPGFSPGFENLMFSDTLGQLLVKRTILYLYAREDNLAWDTLRRDVSRYYLTSAWVPQLQEEILKTLGASPY
ncbi:MAG: hypothetical protein Q7O12_11400 [Deltaproteobacteria bacterium]|nr:hypothetical protein [Deltaproteobacteria bacterium]